MGLLEMFFGGFSEDFLANGINKIGKEGLKGLNKDITKLKKDKIKKSDSECEEDNIFKKEEKKVCSSPSLSNISLEEPKGITLDKDSLRNAIILKEVLDNKRIAKRRSRRKSPFRSERL